MGLFISPRIFLDTNHLVELSRLQRGEGCSTSVLPERATAYRKLAAKLNHGELTPVTTIDQSFEWCRHRSLEPALQLATVLDGYPTVLDIAPQVPLFLIEIVQECRRLDPAIAVEPPSPIGPLFQRNDAVAFFIRWYRGTTELPLHLSPGLAARFPISVADRVRAVAAGVEAERYRDPHSLLAMQDAFTATKAQPKGETGFSQASRLEYLDRNLGLDAILRDLSPAHFDTLRTHVQLERCPGFDLFASVMWQFTQAKATLQENDVGDINYLHVLPYADYSLIEKATWGRVGATRLLAADRVFKHPEDLIEALPG